MRIADQVDSRLEVAGNSTQLIASPVKHKL